MNHSHQAHGHQHPETFDEVIARGFPRHGMEDMVRAREEMKRERGTPRGPLVMDEPAGQTATRSDQAAMSDDLRMAFKNAIVKLVEDGGYLTLIEHHMDMTHMMHGSMGEIGLYRFLAWHRRYLVEFERALQRVDRVLRPGASDVLGVPYWRWQDPFPSWMVDFLPANDPVGGDPPRPRKNAPPPQKATAADVDIIVTQFAVQDTGLEGENDYTKFTFGVEGWGLRPNGTDLPGHNHGHSWIGGIMNNTSTSPTDPMFWLHHAEVDRLWHVWRLANPDPRPPLAGTDLIMDPWPESYDDVLNPTLLGYAYDSTSP